MWEEARAFGAAARDDAPLGGEAPPSYVVLPGEQQRDRQKTPSSWLAAGTAAVVIAVVGIVVVAIGHSASTDPSTTVFDAAQKTLAQRSAAVDVTGTMSARGRTLPITGTGVVDFGTHAMSLDLTMQVGATSLVEHERAVGGRIYIGMVVGGRDLSATTGGRHWIGLPFLAGSSQPGSGDPLAQIQMMADRGNHVVSLGTRTVDGVTLTGYSVTPTRDAVLKGIQQTLDATELDGTARSQLAQKLAGVKMNPPTIEVWFDAGHLIHLMRVQMSLGGTTSVSGVLDMTFSHYGTPAHVAAPARGDVISFADYLRLAQSSGAKLP